MIVEYIRYKLPPDRADLLAAAYRQAETFLRASPHCLAYELTRCAEVTAEAVELTLRIEWDSAEGHMKGFRGSAGFPPFLAAIRGFIPDILEMRHYQPTDISWRR